MTFHVNRMALGIGTAVTALTLAAGVYASAQNQTPDRPGRLAGRRMGPPMGGLGPGPGLGLLAAPRLASELGLSDSQKDQIKSVMTSHRDEWTTYGERLASARQALMAAITAAQFDEATIRQRAADLGSAEADMGVASARAYAEALQLLTAEQIGRASCRERV